MSAVCPLSYLLPRQALHQSNRAPSSFAFQPVHSDTAIAAAFSAVHLSFSGTLCHLLPWLHCPLFTPVSALLRGMGSLWLRRRRRWLGLRCALRVGHSTKQAPPAPTPITFVLFQVFVLDRSRGCGCFLLSPSPAIATVGRLDLTTTALPLTTLPSTLAPSQAAARAARLREVCALAARVHLLDAISTANASSLATSATNGFTFSHV